MTADLDSFFEQSGGLCHADYWAQVAALWREAGAEGRRDERWAGVWDQAQLAPGSQLGLMTEEERAALAQLPAEVRLARQAQAGPLAWRLADGDADATVARERIVALFLAAADVELVVLPRDV